MPKIQTVKFLANNPLRLPLRPAILPMEGVADAKLWVDAAVGRIIRQESTTTAAGTTSTTVQVVEYDAAITIEPPVQ